MSKHVKRIVCFMMTIFVIVGCMAATASAATSGGQNTRTIYVETKANYWKPGSSSITLKQQAATETYAKLTNKSKTKTKKVYADYTVSYKAVDGKYAGKHSGTVKFNGASKKINLKPDTTYQITVSYNSTGTTLSHMKNPFGYSWTKCSGHSWWVNSTYKVSWYR